jgi:hypothetical protein
MCVCVCVCVQVIEILLTRGALNGLRLELKITTTLFGEMSFNVSGMVCTLTLQRRYSTRLSLGRSFHGV